MAWYDSAVFYHIHPLSLCGCEHESMETQGDHFAELEKWAEHAKKMGCNAVYIGPVFETETHGYGITDYYKIDCRLGTNEDFKKWVSKCHSLGLRVVADCVFNHVGRGFFAFVNLLKNKKKSPYKEWFSNVNFSGNNEFGDGFCYENWGGYGQLVKLNLLCPWVEDYLLDVVRYWISEFDIDGIRIDAIDELDYDFIKNLRKTAVRQKLDFWLLGEIPDRAYSRWINDKMLHSAANNELEKAFIFAHTDCGYPGLAKLIRRMGEQYPLVKLYTFADNYDVSRIYEKLNKPQQRYLVTLLQYTVFGSPALYCGSEFSLNLPAKRDVSDAGNTKEVNIKEADTKEVNLKEADTEKVNIKEADTENAADTNNTKADAEEPYLERKPLLKLENYKDACTTDEITHLHCLLGRAYQQFPELSRGRTVELLLAEEQFAFGRVFKKAAVITAVNNENSFIRIQIPVPIHAKRAVDMLEAVIDWEKEPKESLDLSGCVELGIRDNELILDLPPYGGRLIRVTG